MAGAGPAPAVTIGMATPFTRPAHTATILAANLFDAIAVILAVGLNSSLITINSISSLGQGQVETGLAKGSSGQQTLTAGQSRQIITAIRAQPGTLGYVAIADGGPVINSISYQQTGVVLDVTPLLPVVTPDTPPPRRLDPMRL